MHSETTARAWAGSIVSMVVNHGISLGLGACRYRGSLLQQRRTGQPTDTLNGFKGAWYLGAGLGAAGLLIAVAFLVNELLQAKRIGEASDKRQLSLELQPQFQPSAFAKRGL
jgi:hypothetical protein